MLEATTDRPMIELTGIRKDYGPVTALKGVDLSIRQGEVHALIGPSGCGKSTLLRCVNLLETPTAGTVRVNQDSFTFGAGQRPPEARVVDGYRSRLGMVFQHFELFPHMTILENVMSGPVIVKRMPKPEARDLAMALLEKVGLADKAGSYARNISGGQAQRAAIARALAMEPAVLLFDEVTSALDPELVDEVLRVMRALAEDGKTMIIVTHEMRFARDVAGGVTFMNAGQIVEQGSAADVFENPQTERTRAFLSRFRMHG